MGDDEGEAKFAGGAANVAWKMARLGLHNTDDSPSPGTRRRKADSSCSVRWERTTFPRGGDHRRSACGVTTIATPPFPERRRDEMYGMTN